MEILKTLREDRRYRLTLAAAWAAWIATGLVVLLRATETLSSSQGLLAVVTVGIAIAASVALTRMRLATTITQVFEAGLTISTNTAPAPGYCLVAVDDDGVILSASGADAVGWEASDLVGRDLSELVILAQAATLSHGRATKGLIANQGGGTRRDVRVTLNRLGDRNVATISPQW